MMCIHFKIFSLDLVQQQKLLWRRNGKERRKEVCSSFYDRLKCSFTREMIKEIFIYIPHLESLFSSLRMQKRNTNSHHVSLFNPTENNKQVCSGTEVHVVEIR